MEKRSRSYLQLIKPGITLSNTIAAVAGLLLGLSQASSSWLTALSLIAGTALIIASACVINNITDRDIDRRMKRTSRRVLTDGSISLKKAVVFASLLGVAGFTTLGLGTNMVTTLLGVLAVVWYVVIYGIAKRRTIFSTIIGAVAGALPPMAGYTAVVGAIDAAAIIVFVLMFLWQLPHFYAIAIFRRDDYKKAGLPIWSVRRSVRETKAQILCFVVIFTLVVPLLSAYGYTGLIYLVGLVGLSLYWLIRGVISYQQLDDETWARHMFGISLIVMLGMCGLIGIGGYVL